MINWEEESIKLLKHAAVGAGNENARKVIHTLTNGVSLLYQKWFLKFIVRVKMMLKLIS